MFIKCSYVFVRYLLPSCISSKEKRRQEVAEALAVEVASVPPSRLLSLISQALKYQQAHGLLPKGQVWSDEVSHGVDAYLVISLKALDIFRDSRKSVRKDVDEKVPKKQAGYIKFTSGSHPETSVFAPDGSGLVTGSVDGFIEIWDYDNCRLRNDLDYQAKEELMMHDNQSPILCSCFSKDAELLATGIHLLFCCVHCVRSSPFCPMCSYVVITVCTL